MIRPDPTILASINIENEGNSPATTTHESNPKMTNVVLDMIVMLVLCLFKNIVIIAFSQNIYESTPESEDHQEMEDFG
ncbi:MAG: hypothetical protein ACI9FN_003526 [Saprospiraceae bacterium]|jgi:hypothetical protein